MATDSPSRTTIYPYNTTLVRELLKNKRKVRDIRSCFPCRHRKVRCDGQTPCSSCLKRNHPELCRVPTSSGLGGSALGDEEEEVGAVPDHAGILGRLERIEELVCLIKAELRGGLTASATAATTTTENTAENAARTRKSSGRHAVEDDASIFLGSASLAPGSRREPPVSGDAMLHDAMIDQIVPRAYPFTNLWGAEATAGDVCETLPDDSDVIRYWHAYSSTAYPFYPVLVSIEKFSQSLFAFLNRRASAQEGGGLVDDEQLDSSWLALLFAVMACGVQFAEDPTKERDLRSKVFVCSSFHCLRMSNFFNHTNIHQVQALALIGHCLRNNLDTNSAWILMGATIRLAQSVGLDEPSPSLPSEEQQQRTRLWWTLLWQDTFLSFTYDRPPSCFITKDCPIPYTANDAAGLSYHECMFKICHIILEKTHLEATTAEVHPKNTLSNYQAQLESIRDSAAPFLTSKAHCTSLQDHLERLALGIHLGYVICRVTQANLDSSPRSNNSPTSTAAAAALATCKRRATQVLECFLDLYRFSASLCRSWVLVHNAVSCAITLHRLNDHTPPEGTVDPAHSSLVRRLFAVLEKEAKDSEWCDADTNVRYFGPYSRALKALRGVYPEYE